MNTLSKVVMSALGGLALSGVALAQNTAPSSSKSSMGSMSSMQGNMRGMMGMHHAMQGMHTMPATVTSIDAKTGIMKVSAAGMGLTLHFPPASVAHLKAGDKITLHLGFSKP
ncbi:MULTISPECIES: hypothetical protein [unclassified Rhodanobacter]|jgi:hypothetical protein|uniref:Copper-binding protein n=1 Tax=Rhodanobacter humi TaxID=1888173 RepID=A0ABV4AVC4_9GAMM|nr:MAG: hypothetical protein EPN58_17460 [Rhodanobacter sp.]TBR71455.1 MAG: hypothetical protein EPN64_19485 [Burkholderiaceae bacterium]